MTGISRWTKDTALAQLDLLRTQVNDLSDEQPMSEELTRWIFNTRRFLGEVFGEASVYFTAFAAMQWNSTPSGTIGGPNRPMESMDPNLGIRRLQREALTRNLTAARGLLAAASDELRERSLEEVYDGKNTGPEASVIMKILSLAERKLRKTIRDMPTAEREVQDRFEDLLNGAEISFRREQERVSYSSKTYTPDFTVDSADLAVEIKFCGSEGREKEIIAEINDDIMAYRKRWGNVVFVIYDVSHIRDTEMFSQQFEDAGVLVRVVKH